RSRVHRTRRPGRRCRTKTAHRGRATRSRDSADGAPARRELRAFPYGEPMPSVTVNGIDVYYERDGAGPRLLFLNGSGATLASSALLIQQFTKDFDVVARDQRGLGR